MTLGTMRDLFIDNLRDLYSAETQLTRALPRMARAAHAPDLKKAFEQHLLVTRIQLERLDKVFTELGVSPRGKRCQGMEGLLKEGEEIMSEKGDPFVKDAGLIGAAQRVEHYEIAGYGCARTYAQQLGMKQAARLLERTLEEEKKTDERLNVVAERNVNLQAEEHSQTRKTPPRGGNSGASGRASGSSATRSAGVSASVRTVRTRQTAKSPAAARPRSAQGMAPKSMVTTDHDQIRRWAEERLAKPACVRRTGAKGDIGILRLDFPGYSGKETLQEISWDDFFQKFEEQQLALLFREGTAGGGKSNFNRLIKRQGRRLK